MTTSFLFPLRWESTGNRWWFVSPIDWAAANGHYEIVEELLSLDPNLLIKLTSLPRTRRLETVWDDDDDEKFGDVAKCRAKVALQLLRGSESKKGYKSLIGEGGCGGWILYMAAAGGDLDFVKELLDRNPGLVFGEGEYGVTDMFYAAAKSKNCDVFRALFEYSVSPLGRLVDESSIFRSELVNRGVHAAARGGNLEILIQLLDEYGDPTNFTDACGSTVLHSAAAQGRVQIVKYLTYSYNNILNSVDNRGNTALHIAAYFGHYSVIELLLSSSPSSSSLTNKDGDTFLHLVFAGFGFPNFRCLNRQIDLTKQVIKGHNLEEVINIQNKDGRTPIHIAIMNHIPANLLNLIMSISYINLHIRDNYGKTPLDLVKRRGNSISSMRRMVSVGGFSYTLNDNMHSISMITSPGTRFGIPDSEIYLNCGTQVSEPLSDGYTSEEWRPPMPLKHTNIFKRTSSQLKNLLLKPQRKTSFSDTISWKSYENDKESAVVSLRQQFARVSALPMNKRVQGIAPYPRSVSRFGTGLGHRVLQTTSDSNGSVEA